MKVCIITITSFYQSIHKAIATLFSNVMVYIIPDSDNKRLMMPVLILTVRSVYILSLLKVNSKNITNNAGTKVTIMAIIATIADVVVSSQNASMQLLLTDLNVLTEFQDENGITRTPRIARPKTNGFWSEVFPYLGDDNQNYDFKLNFISKDQHSIG